MDAFLVDNEVMFELRPQWVKRGHTRRQRIRAILADEARTAESLICLFSTFTLSSPRCHAYGANTAICGRPRVIKSPRVRRHMLTHMERHNTEELIHVNVLAPTNALLNKYGPCRETRNDIGFIAALNCFLLSNRYRDTVQPV